MVLKIKHLSLLKVELLQLKETSQDIHLLVPVHLQFKLLEMLLDLTL
tara:strand:- start:724 stop:864 length:141 start_codon:yes stop_codon:yes gene_type:complete